MLVAVAAWQGWRRGLMIEVLSYGGLVFGLAAGAILAPAAAGLFSGVPTKALVSVIAIFGTGVLFQTAGFLIGASIRSHIRRRRVGHSFDAAGGAAISCILLLVGVWFVAVTMANGPSPALARAIKQSATVRAIDRVAPRPPNVLASVKKFLETSRFPEVFAGISPRLAPPVALPDPSRIQSEGVAAAAASTVKISGEACDFIQEGSGWVAAPGVVVTNAHVVAGVHEARVQPPDGHSNLAATPVAYDSDRDLAVLSVPGLEAAPLALADSAPARGTEGAVLGYPEHGPFTAVPAAVRTTVNAKGRDIYYDHQVERKVTVLRASVRPGNSGGPVVAVDGEVIGVIFAAAVGEPETSYALAPEEVRPVLASAGAPVGTGDCVE